MVLINAEVKREPQNKVFGKEGVNKPLTNNFDRASTAYLYYEIGLDHLFFVDHFSYEKFY